MGSTDRFNTYLFVLVVQEEHLAAIAAAAAHHGPAAAAARRFASCRRKIQGLFDCFQGREDVETEES